MPKPLRSLFAFQSQQLCRRGKGAESADGAARMHAAQVMLRQHPLGDFALDFESGEESEHESLAVDAAEFLRHHQGAAQRRNRRMRQEAVDMGRIDAHLTVVPIVSVAGGAEHARRHGRRHFVFASTQQERIRPAAGLLRFFDKQLNRMLLRAGDKKPEAVEQAARADARRLRPGIASKVMLSTNSAAAAVVFMSRRISMRRNFLHRP